FDDDMLYPLLLAAGLLASGLLWFGLRRRRA
ncbi:TPA: LPXTG cell wall anchor domain-containing protein, partial [Pseudomonas aeruginosa]|nr:LPXTG cell wall anchor domain-containing protein [Pseudomonas aeruginosa]